MSTARAILPDDNSNPLLALGNTLLDQVEEAARKLREMDLGDQLERRLEKARKPLPPPLPPPPAPTSEIRSSVDEEIELTIVLAALKNNRPRRLTSMQNEALKRAIDIVHQRLVEAKARRA
jgi:hypothetical protein